MAKISVIVPVYKVEEYITTCIDSIIAQTFGDLEIILVDDGSPDRCGEICEEYAKKDTRIKVIHKANGGLSDARNVGFEVSSGEYISFIDSDDYIHPTMLQKLYEACKKNDLKMAGCDFQYIFDNSDTVISGSTGITEVVSAEEFFLRIMDTHKFLEMTAWNKLYHRSLFASGVRYPKGKLFEDQGTTYRFVFQNEKIAHVSEPLYSYRKQRAGAITSQNYSLREKDRIEMTSQMVEYVKKNHPNIATEVITYKVINCNLGILNTMIKAGAKDKEMLSGLKKDTMKNMTYVIKSNISCMKKIQIVISVVSFEMYKLLFKKLKR